MTTKKEKTTCSLYFHSTLLFLGHPICCSVHKATGDRFPCPSSDFGKVSGNVGRGSKLPGALEPAAGAGDGDGLVHDPFAQAEVLVDPFGHLLVVAGDFVGFEAAGRMLAALGEGY